MKNKIDKQDVVIVSVLCITVIFIALLFFIGEINDIKVKGTIDCSSGNIDLDYRADWKYQSSLKDMTDYIGTSREDLGLLTYFSDYFPRSFALEGIDNITCRMEYELEGNMIGLRKLGE